MTDANTRAWEAAIRCANEACRNMDGDLDLEAMTRHFAAFATPARVDRDSLAEAMHTAFMSGDTNKLTTTSLPGEWPNLTPSFAEEWRKVADAILALLDNHP